MFAQQFPGIDGFLGTRGSFMLDLVFVAMFAIVPTLVVSVYLVRFRRQYRLHKTIQLSLGTILLVAVTAFETEQMLVPWEPRAEESPYFDSNAKWQSVAGMSLLIHLFFAVPTTLLWIFVIVQGLRNFEREPIPNRYSNRHRMWGRLAAFEMTMTAITGWVFYYLAFVA